MVKRFIIYVVIFSISIFSVIPLIYAQYEGQPELISLDLKGMDIRDVLKILSQKSGLNIVADKDVKGTVTIYVRDVEVMDALDIIVSTNELAYEQKGTLIRVMTDRKYEKLHGKRLGDEAETVIVKPDYANTEVTSAIEEMSTKVGKIIPEDGRFNTIVLIDNLENIERIFVTPNIPERNKVREKTKLYLDEMEEKEQGLRPRDLKESKLKKTKPFKARTRAKLKASPEKQKRTEWFPFFGTKAKKKEAEEIEQRAEKKRSPVFVDGKRPYEEYYLMIRKEINNIVEQQDVSGLKGEVELQFTLDREGFIVRGPVVLNKPDLKLVRAAVNCVKKVSPFPPFPQAMKKEETEFYVVVRYD